jgi:hypothetical protein
LYKKKRRAAVAIARLVSANQSNDTGTLPKDGYSPFSLESFSTESYIMIERIGRSRQHGEIIVGKRSLNIELNISQKLL